MVKYKCGHESVSLIVTDGTPGMLSNYLNWCESVGLHGDKSLCWECWNKKLLQRLKS